MHKAPSVRISTYGDTILQLNKSRNRLNATVTVYYWHRLTGTPKTEHRSQRCYAGSSEYHGYK